MCSKNPARVRNFLTAIIMILRRPLFTALIVSAGSVGAAPTIIVPGIVSVANENPFSGQGFTFVTNNSGMTPAVNNGDSLAAAQAAVHGYTGFTESWVTNASTADYFETGGGNANPPSVVFDLGTDTAISNIILWQYQNDGGGAANVGNHTRTLDLRFNAAFEGSASFLGPATTLTMMPVTDGDGLGNGNDLSGANTAQTFGLGSVARYVQLTVTDNYRNFQGITAGGDRAGLGEVRFYGEAIPEPGSLSLLLLASGAMVRRRR
jgi:hypothetical protein